MIQRYRPDSCRSSLVKHDWDPQTGVATQVFEWHGDPLDRDTILVAEPSAPGHEAWSESWRQPARVRDIRVGDRIVDPETGRGRYL